MGAKAGKLRPSQAVTQNGPGSLVDLPKMSMIMLAADQWDKSKARRVDEPRLARRLGVTTFRTPAWYDRKTDAGGLPARIFPTFLVCPRCRRLAPHETFQLDERRGQHICGAAGCPGRGKAAAYPARFMVACSEGHLDDFPWHEYVHPGVACNEELKLEDSGSTGAITDLWVKCAKHDKRKNLGQAFGLGGKNHLPSCSGARPWLPGLPAEVCRERPRVLLRGASNAYFSVVRSALSIPPWADPLQLALGEYADMMAKVDSLEKLEMWLDVNNAPALEPFTPAQVWAGLERRRSEEEGEAVADLRVEEWQTFQAGHRRIDPKTEFKAFEVEVPHGFGRWLERVVLLERLREVRALRGFTRIDAIPDVGSLEDVEKFETKLSPVFEEQRPTWYPGVELRGEGIFVQLREPAVAEWEARTAVAAEKAKLEKAQAAWSHARGLEPAGVDMRFVLLHSLSHMLIRQLGLDCGYASASLRERIYSSAEVGATMAGLLIYTATPDSEGSLGGLVEMGRPEDLGPLLARALEDAELCAGDPHCASRGPQAPNNDLNSAACHSCLLVSETSCEAANRYLDRGVVVPSLRGDPVAFFRR
ncbi:MAG TPA: DUF1998 domain-containing protein [Baekduia sp.]|nr:DUF1998 domain-containing protein [Baekduia sp.]